MSDCDEYCSNHGCNQGRNCPARIKRAQKAKSLQDSVDVPSIAQIVLVGVLAAIVIGVIHGW